jgi:hypothetical protein
MHITKRKCSVVGCAYYPNRSEKYKPEPEDSVRLAEHGFYVIREIGLPVGTRLDHIHNNPRERGLFFVLGDFYCYAAWETLGLTSSH